MTCVIAALGGNAFARADQPLTMETQFEFAEHAARQLLPLVTGDQRLLLVHGNGPQVGQMLRRVEASLVDVYRLPLDVCVAESEGELGFVLEQAFRNVLPQAGIHRELVTLLTMIEVSADDPALLRPSKPIGPFLDEDHAIRLRHDGFTVIEDSGRGYRRVVPSPRPIRVLQQEAIRTLLNTNQLVIAAGGGGIPVVNDGGVLHGIEAVIDKDWSAALLADSLDADLLVIITCVPHAYLHFGTDRQSPIHRATPAELGHWLDENQFAGGSMRPKIEACIEFVSRPGRRAVICDADSLPDAIAGNAGTIVDWEFDSERSGPG